MQLISEFPVSVISHPLLLLKRYLTKWYGPDQFPINSQYTHKTGKVSVIDLFT